MSLENQLGSVVSRLRALEEAIQAIEATLAIEKAKLTHLQDDLNLVKEQLRTPT